MTAPLLVIFSVDGRTYEVDVTEFMASGRALPVLDESMVGKSVEERLALVRETFGADKVKDVTP